MTRPTVRSPPELRRLAEAWTELDQAIRAAIAAGVCERAIREALPQLGARSLKRQRRIVMLLQRDGPECAWCGIRLGDTTTITLDHVVPKSRGGSDGIANLMLSCRRCNGLRGAATVDEWLPLCTEHGLEPRLAVIADRLAALRRQERREHQHPHQRPPHPRDLSTLTAETRAVRDAALIADAAASGRLTSKEAGRLASGNVQL